MIRSRYFCTILYPDSMPFNEDNTETELLQWLKVKGLSGCLSPLHYPDKVNYTDDGQIVEDSEHIPKKHYHLLIYFKGNKSLDSVKFILEPLNMGTEKVQVCNGATAYLRYMLHLDDIEKEQFDPYSLRDFGGFDSRNYVVSTEEIEKDIFFLIRDNHISTMKLLIEYIYQCDMPHSVFKYVKENAYFINSLFYQNKGE